MRERISAAAASAGRRPADVTLVAVSKTFGVEYVRAAHRAGQRDFGENKVQEALEKIDATADTQIAWHLIGHLQSNKARKAGAAFAAIHSIDSVDLLRRVDAAADEAGADAGRADPGGPGRRDHQVRRRGSRRREHTTGGGRLSGSTVGRSDAAAPVVRGRRAGPPVLPAAASAPRPPRRARASEPTRLRELSMGMSHDFEVAIEEGATLVRVGTAIFGKRTVRT